MNLNELKFFTIGVYNSNKNEFYNKLIANKIDTFCDIRQRRGVRGSKYSFVNSIILQNDIKTYKINYLYLKELAPTMEIRKLQNDEDALKNILKKDRNSLSNIFINEYKNKILKNYDFKLFLNKLDSINSKRVVFFCVEQIPEACHRSLVAEYLKMNFGSEITNL